MKNSNLYLVGQSMLDLAILKANERLKLSEIEPKKLPCNTDTIINYVLAIISIILGIISIIR